MSERERDEITAAIAAFQAELYARLGRWAIAVIATVAAASAAAMYHWQSAVGRIGALEAVDARRAASEERSDSETQAWRMKVESKLGRIEALLEGKQCRWPRSPPGSARPTRRLRPLPVATGKSVVR